MLEKIITNCEVCGKEFEYTRIGAKKRRYCSQRCNSNGWRKRNPEKAKEHERKQELKRKGINRYNSEVHKKWYERKKTDDEWLERQRETARNLYYKIQIFLREYKMSQGCIDCGYNEHHAALQFDHIADDKEINVCNAKSIEMAQKEIKKCEVVCANCHFIRTWNRLHPEDIERVEE
jgi:hypothetical protein